MSVRRRIDLLTEQICTAAEIDDLKATLVREYRPLDNG
jgi:hypothetical protein